MRTLQIEQLWHRECAATRRIKELQAHGYKLIGIVLGTNRWTGKIWRRHLLAQHPTAAYWETVAFGWGQGNDRIAIFTR